VAIARRGLEAAGRSYAARIDGVTYIGHGTLLIELGGIRVLTDPALRARILHIHRRVPLPRLQELRGLDAVAISHAHLDHLDVRSLRLLEPGWTAIAPRGCGRILRRAGAREVVEVDVGDRVPLGDLVVEAVPAAHDGRRFPRGRRRPALGYLFESSPSVYFAGDTDLFPEMSALAGRVDVAALPVAGWGPTVGEGHLDPARAARAAALIRARIAVPIHWGTFGVGSGDVPADMRPPQEFRRAASRIAPGVDVRVLNPGERLSLR
jgi:L-ascorbate metabolism protein UlaG (beta-lactamase superfamily)